MRLDSVQIAAPDPAEAAGAYALLLGFEPLETGGRARFQLTRGAVEIERGDAGLRAIRFGAEPGDPPWPAEPESFHGLTVEVTAHPPAPVPTSLPAAHAIDHVVVRTPDPDRTIDLWRDRLGLRLAFDHAFPERGLRLLFFRTGGITFEFAAIHPPPEDRRGPDCLYGVSYRVVDLARHRERLVASGLDVTPIRPGHRPGTVVATVRSGTAGVPTLLLEEAARVS